MDSIFGKLKHEAVKLKREAKKVAELESPLEKKLREATSNQNWGCPNSLLYEITVAANEFHERRKIMLKIEEKLQSEPHRWRRILKTLTLLEFMIKNCSEDILPEMIAEQSRVRRLQNFHCHEEGKERGGTVREKANAIIDMVANQNVLRQARDEAKAHRAKMTEGMREHVAGNSTRPREEHQSYSRASMEARFNELKKQRDDARRNEGSQRRERDSKTDSPRDKTSSPRDRDEDRRDDGYEIHLPPPPGGGKPADRREPDLLSDSDDDDYRRPAAGPGASPARAAEPPQADLLDFFGDEPAKAPAPPSAEPWCAFGEAPAPAPAASSEAWADFSAAPEPAGPADLLGGMEAPTQAAPVMTDMLGMDFPAAAPVAAGYSSGPSVAGPASADFQAPIFTGPTFTGQPVATLAPPTSTLSMPTTTSPFDLPAAAGAPGAAPAAPADAPKTFLDDMPGELWDLNLGSGGAVPVR